MARKNKLPQVLKQIYWTPYIRLNINRTSRLHVFVTEFDNSLNSWRLLKFKKGFLSILEYFNLHQHRKIKYGWRKVKVGCCENHSNLHTALKALTSIVLITLAYNSTLLFILDNFCITMKYLKGPTFAPAKTEGVEDKKGSLDWSINEFSVMLEVISAVEWVATWRSWLWQVHLQIQNGQLCWWSRTSSFGVWS